MFSTKPGSNPEGLHPPVSKNQDPLQSTQPSETNPEELYAPVIDNGETPESSSQTEAVNTALPKDFVGLSSSRDSPTQLNPSDVDSFVYDPDHDEVPEIPERPDDLGMSDDGSPPPVPPRLYPSDFESDDDEAVDEDEGEMIKTIYDYLAKAGGRSQETEKLYDTLDQYWKIHLQEKTEYKGDNSEVSHATSTTRDVPVNEGQYAPEQEAMEKVGVS